VRPSWPSIRARPATDASDHQAARRRRSGPPRGSERRPENARAGERVASAKSFRMIKRFSTPTSDTSSWRTAATRALRPTIRRYPNERVIEAFDTTLELAQTMDELGYEALWLAEHHFQHEGYECIPNIPLLAVHIRESHPTAQDRLRVQHQFRPGIRSVWPKTTRPPHPDGGRLTSASAVVTTRVKSRASAIPCSTPRPTASSSRNSSRSS